MQRTFTDAALETPPSRLKLLHSSDSTNLSAINLSARTEGDGSMSRPSAVQHSSCASPTALPLPRNGSNRSRPESHGYHQKELKRSSAAFSPSSIERNGQVTIRMIEFRLLLMVRGLSRCLTYLADDHETADIKRMQKVGGTNRMQKVGGTNCTAPHQLHSTRKSRATT